MSEPRLYRRPQDPGGYVGGYNWGPALGGAGLLLLSNIGATQWIAHCFRYQSALGRPWVRFAHLALYSPLGWVTWLWRYGGAADPAVRLTLLSGASVVIVGSILTIGIFAVFNLRRTKRLLQNAEDLHGSARWASPRTSKQQVCSTPDKACMLAAGTTTERGTFTTCAITALNMSWPSPRRAPAKASVW